MTGYRAVYMLYMHTSPGGRLKDHYADYEPTLQQLKQRYEVAMKEKMLTRLERDRAVGQVHGLKSTLRNLDQTGGQFFMPGKEQFSRF